MISVLESSDITSGQIDDFFSMDRDFFPNPWSRDQWSGLKSSDNQVLYFEKDHQSKIRCFALYAVNELESLCHLYKILVLPQYRGLGVAKKIMDFALKDLRDGGLKSVYLEVSTSNSVAISFYKGFGFKILVEKKKFYENGDNAFAMQRML